MNIKKVITCFLIALVIVTLISIGLYIFEQKNDKKPKKKKEIPTTETIMIDYATYQELRSEVHENETYAILIVYADDETCIEFKNEVLLSFDGKESKIYEIDLNKLSKVEISGVIDDVTKVMGYDKPTMITPTLFLMKNGKVVYKQEGLAYSPTITKYLDKNKIK